MLSLPRTDVAAPQTTPTPPAHRPNWLVRKLFGEDGFSFRDVLDAVNPLQHIPFVGQKLQAARGAEIGALPKLIGGALFGGTTGLVTSVASIATHEITGRSPERFLLDTLQPNTAKAMAVVGETARDAPTDASASSVTRRVMLSRGAMNAYAAASRLADRTLLG